MFFLPQRILSRWKQEMSRVPFHLCTKCPQWTNRSWSLIQPCSVRHPPQRCAKEAAKSSDPPATFTQLRNTKTPSCWQSIPHTWFYLFKLLLLRGLKSFMLQDRNLFTSGIKMRSQRGEPPAPLGLCRLATNSHAFLGTGVVPRQQSWEECIIKESCLFISDLTY